MREVIITDDLNEIPEDYKYDTERSDIFVYRHKYTGDEIHIAKEPPLRAQVKALPSVQRQPKRGKWVDIGMWLEGRKYGKEHGEMIDAYSCDYCGYNQYHKTNFCPNCGTDMREGVQTDAASD